MWKADLLSYRGEMNFIRAYQGNSLVLERPLKNNVIYYTASDGGSITPYYLDHFGDAVIVSNKYEDGLGVITFDRSVTIIGVRAFTSNSRIESVVIPSSVTTISGMAFYKCINLKKITIPSSVTRIEGSAFGGCSSLESIVIPSSVVYIGGFAFGECSSLIEIIVNSQTPPELYYNSAAGEYTSFIKNAPGRLFKVPSGSVNTYKAATGWSNYADSIVSQ